MDKIEQDVDWTILIYANGNNELEPEMRQAMRDAEKVGSSSNVHVAMQIGRAEYKLVKLIRHDIPLEDRDSWSGVRRYFVQKGSSELVGNLRQVNMADPKQLYEFMKWGMRSYPAKRYMLILGGHSYDGVGMMTDYRRKAPYIMGYPEMVRAINMAANEMGKNIDILVLDTCNANSLELLYEFGKDIDHAIQSVITYIASGPIEGLPYDRIIHYVQADSEAKDGTVVIKDIIENLSYDLISFEIDHQKLQLIKQLFHEKTLEFLSKSTDDAQACHNISRLERKAIIEAISENLTPIILRFKRSQHNNGSLFTVTAGVTDHLNLLKRYDQLGFAQDNCWASSLYDHAVNANRISAEQKESLLPLELSPEEVCAYLSIMNPELGESQKRTMLEELYHYKKWTL